DQIPAYEEVLSQFKTGLEELRPEVQKISFPEKEMFELSERLITNIRLLKHPVEQKVIHHHHIPKTAWITAALFVVLCLASVGWFTSYNKFELYKASDTKYRYLKFVSNVSLGKQ